MPLAVHRIEVQSRIPADDPTGPGVLAEIRQLGFNEVQDVRASRIFLLQGDDALLTPANVQKIAAELLIDPVTETFTLGAHPAPGSSLIEVHLKPGVTDPVAESTEMAIRDLLSTQHSALDAPPLVSVRTGRKYILLGHIPADMINLIAKRLLVNESIESGFFEPYLPAAFPAGKPYDFTLQHVPLRDLSEDALLDLARRGHLFLDLREMQAIQKYFRDQNREPTDAELETLAQTWSEHCVHKTLKSTIAYTGPGFREPGIAESDPVIIQNLIKTTVFKATMDLINGNPSPFTLDPVPLTWTLSVFKDNAGVIEFDDQNAVCMKVETHNRPSAIEPYGGAATGIGGCIRDVMGTGLGARPFANTDVFCFADPATPVDSLPNGVIHPRRTAQRVVAGVRDYGNRMGIPTVNGALFFDPRYIGNPLVFCGTVGIMPRQFALKGQALPGDRIVVMGGRTGRDGIHGATFSSAVVTTSHADEFSHAVQIGNAITEKKMLDVILQARDWQGAPINNQQAAISNPPPGPLFHAITDCGAGGLSSAIGEMGEKTGATVQLDRVPLKYAGLSYAEIWISEAQERMVLAVPPEKVPALLQLCAAENVEATDIGTFDGSGKLTLLYQNTTVATMDMSFIHDGIPNPVRQATYTPPDLVEPALAAPRDYAKVLHDLLAMPTIASKHWIIRQYDHEVQGGTVGKPLVGPQRDGPADAAVIRPLLSSPKAVVLSNGCQPRFGDIDPYQMALNGIDEALRNSICAGGDPARTAILDNFCWPKCTDPKNLGALVRACLACYDGAMAFKTPFVSGKDSLSNEFITDHGQRIQIPYTLLISSMSVINDAAKCITMDAKKPGNQLLIAGLTKRELGGSRYFELCGQLGAGVPTVDLQTAPALMHTVANLIAAGLIRSAHDCSEGGIAVALAEMLFAGGLGATIDLAGVPCAQDADSDDVLLFSESPTRFLLEIEPHNFEKVAATLKGHRFGVLGLITEKPHLKIRSLKAGYLMDEPLATLKQSWIQPLDW